MRDPDNYQTSSNQSTSLGPNSRPRLALGIEVLTIGEKNWGERVWIGGSRFGIEITRQLHFFQLSEYRATIFPALRALNGERTLAAITTALEIPIDNFIRLVQYLLREELIVAGEVKNLSAIRNNSKQVERKSIEEIHLPPGREREILALRESAKIEIVGHDRIATSLAALLYGSGIKRIRLSQDNCGNALDTAIDDSDLGGIALDGSDIGLSKTERFHQIANRYAIYPLKNEIVDGRYLDYGSDRFHANLTISVGYPRSDYHQRWLAEDQKFFIIAGYSQGKIGIGPFVIPGYSPCLRCQQLSAMENDFWREQVRQLQQLSPTPPAPIIPAAVIAALAAAEILDFIDRGNLQAQHHQLSHPLIGREWILPLHSPRTERDQLDGDQLDGEKFGSLLTWHKHPECGCSWALENCHHGSSDKRITRRHSPT
jgi:hypothetical protein